MRKRVESVDQESALSSNVTHVYQESTLDDYGSMKLDLFTKHNIRDMLVEFIHVLNVALSNAVTFRPLCLTALGAGGARD